MTFVVAISPHEVALGSALIRAAATGRGAGLVAAWAHIHLLRPLLFAEQQLIKMLAAVEAVETSSSFCFRTTPGPRTPGLVPHFGDADEISLFEPTLAILATEVAAGAGALIVSNGLHGEDGAPPIRRPGVLRILPCTWDESQDEHDVFAQAGFPTLVISPDVVPHSRSAHEILELCAQLAAHLAVEPPAA